MYHLVWIPKYRKRVLKGCLAARLKELFFECSEMNGWKIEKLNIQVDHVHLLVQLKPTISVCKAIQILKGGSSYIVRKEFPELEEFLWGDSFWGDGYFAETFGRCNEEMIRKYIKNQHSSKNFR